MLVQPPVTLQVSSAHFFFFFGQEVHYLTPQSANVLMIYRDLDGTSFLVSQVNCLGSVGYLLLLMVHQWPDSPFILLDQFE